MLSFHDWQISLFTGQNDWYIYKIYFKACSLIYLRIENEGKIGWQFNSKEWLLYSVHVSFHHVSGAVQCKQSTNHVKLTAL